MNSSGIARQYGLTLVELMISMVLGLMVVFAIGSILVASNSAVTLSDTLADSQEAGRFSADFMNRQLMRTGFDPNDVGFVAFAPVCIEASELICNRNSGAGTGDKIAVRRQAEAGTGSAVTCYGSALKDSTGADISVDVVVTDIYWVEITDGVGNLRCQSFDEEGTVSANPGDSFGNALSLAAGVIAMHSIYGQSNVGPDDDTLNVTTYYNADQVTDWSNVYAIRVAILTEASSSSGSGRSEKNYQLLDSAIYQYNDPILRQIFTTTVALAN